MKHIGAALIGFGVFAGIGCSSSAYPKVAAIYSTLASEAEPPVVTLETQTDFPATGKGEGQCIIVGDLLLTAAHTQADVIDARNEPNLWLLGREIPFERLAMGLKPGSAVPMTEGEGDWTLSWEDFGRDWALLRLGETVELPGGRVVVETGPIRALTKVSLFRGSTDGRYRQRLDTYTFHITNPEEVPSNVIMLAKPEGFEAHGWSGSFVGRWSEADQAWRLIGLFVASPGGTLVQTGERIEGLLVVRPPAEILEWFASGGRGEMPETGP
ncbi:MAG: hypothetical protein ACIAQ0_08775 [Phycisphaerales bacterium JB058]